MAWFYNLNTIKKLTLGFSLICATMGFVGYMGIRGMVGLNHMMEEMYERDLIGLSEVKDANANLIYIGRAVRGAILEPEERQRHAQNIDRYAVAMQEHLEGFAERVVYERVQEMVAEVNGTLPEYLNMIRQALQLLEEGRQSEAVALITEGRAVANRLDDLFTDMGLAKVELAEEAAAAANADYQRARNLMVATIVLAVIASMGLGYFIARCIAGPLNRAVKLCEGVAKLDFTDRLDVNSRDEVGQMAKALNQTIDAVANAMQQINETAAQFTEGSRVISESSQSLAGGAQTQSSSIEEITASVEELARSVEMVKDNATEADKLAKRTNQMAQQGGQAVQKSSEAMELIRSSSTQIAEIIQVISEIASQTNLLALNAAIEAARAGEHGMGFAVVADEVRKLAERSNQAAQEVSKLIRESSSRVEEGSQLSGETTSALSEIVAGVESTVGKISEIAAATVQQASNAAEVSQAIQGVAQVTEQNASGSEELASSSEELGAQAVSLRDLVATFKLS